MLHERQKLQQIIELNLEIAQIHDLDVLLEKVLRAARKLVNAEAGRIYLKDGPELHCRQVQHEILRPPCAPEQKLQGLSMVLPIDHTSLPGYVASTGEIVHIPDLAQLSVDAPYVYRRCTVQAWPAQIQSVLLLPLKYSQEEIVGVLELANAHAEITNDIGAFADDDLPILKLLTNYVAIPIEWAQTVRVRIQGMIRLLTELRDPEETTGHVNRVGAYSVEIYKVWAHRQGLPPEKVAQVAETLRTAAMLHDLGKLAIPQSIRQKPGKLTPEEYAIMQQHTVKGAQMLLKSAQSEYEDLAVQIALNHHEYWDGTGYPGHVNPLTGQGIPGYEDAQRKPQRKKGAGIPVLGRVVAIADVYDALSCRRVHRTALPEAEVLRILENDAGRRFDPEMMAAFLANLDTMRAIARQFPEELS